MGSVEAARRQAAAINEQLVTRGIDRWDPKSIVSTLAVDQKIRIIPVPPDDPRLSGCEGVWDPGERYIYHAISGDPFRDAFVAAHELGHAILEGAIDKVFSRDIDPARTAEAPDIGVDRVWDYSRRERKEVTMDLFARELLLPRGWLRALHIDEGLSARDICIRLGAAYEVIAQQMLDALLLPPPPEKLRHEPLPQSGLDDSQRLAAFHKGSPFLLEAGPGTGKTRTLVARIEHLVDNGVPPNQILVLTFSNRAASELVERIALTRPLESSAMWIGTFHSFGLDIIRRCNEQLELPPDPRLLDLSLSIDLIEDEFARLPLTHYRDLYDPLDKIVGLLRAVSRAKDEVVSAERYRELAEAMSARDEAAGAMAKEVALFYESYEWLKNAKGAVDFGDLVYLPVLLVEGHPEVLAALRDRHRHILVDEYQDVNHASVRLLSALAGEGENLWVVGDARQSIYRFRGASSANMNIFRKTFPKASHGRLAINYRSTKEIVDLFNAFAKRTGSGDGPTAQPDGPGVKPELHVCGTADDEIDGIAGSIRSLRSSGHAWSEQAILVRGNERLATIARQLEAHGVPVLFLGVLFERPEIRDLLSLLSLAHDRYGAALVRLSDHPDFEMSLSEAMQVVERLRGRNQPISGWAGAGISREGLPERACSVLDKIDDIFLPTATQPSPWLICVQTILDHTGIARRMASSNQVADRSCAIAIWQFLNYARLHSAETSWPSTLDFLKRIRRLVRVSDERDLRRLPQSADHIDAVRMMTIHGAKGLEFDVVHLPGLHARGMPGNSIRPYCIPPDGMIVGSEGKTGKQAVEEGLDEEKRCLFYVALSRAKKRTLMYRPSRTETQRANITKFLEGLSQQYVERNVQPAANCVTPSPLKNINVNFEEELMFKASTIAIYKRCPRRFFYTYVLGLGGRREETPYTRMHDAVQRLIDACAMRPIGTALTRAEFDVLFERSWRESGPTDSGYASAYLTMAQGLAENFWSHVGQRPRREIAGLGWPLSGGTILPDVQEVSEDVDGVVHFKRIRTGRSSPGASKAIENRLSRIAVQYSGEPLRYSLIHLADASVLEMPSIASTSDETFAAEQLLAAIQKGTFPQVADSRTCPKCPHYFICGSVGNGELTVPH